MRPVVRANTAYIRRGGPAAASSAPAAIAAAAGKSGFESVMAAVQTATVTRVAGSGFTGRPPAATTWPPPSSATAYVLATWPGCSASVRAAAHAARGMSPATISSAERPVASPGW